MLNASRCVLDFLLVPTPMFCGRLYPKRGETNKQTDVTPPLQCPMLCDYFRLCFHPHLKQQRSVSVSALHFHTHFDCRYVHLYCSPSICFTSLCTVVSPPKSTRHTKPPLFLHLSVCPPVPCFHTHLLKNHKIHTDSGWKTNATIPVSSSCTPTHLIRPAHCCLYSPKS